MPPTEARDFCEWVFAGKAGKLSSTFYSVCALGDRSYQHFCRCGKQLDAALAASGAQELAPRADINKEDYPAVDAWVQICIKSLDAKKADLQPIGEAAAGAAAAAAGGKAAHTKKWGKSRPYFANVVAQEGLCTINSKVSGLHHACCHVKFFSWAWLPLPSTLTHASSPVDC